MRMNHVYSGYNNWSRLIVLGVVPFALLVFFNARIYSGISQRSGRLFLMFRIGNMRTSHLIQAQVRAQLVHKVTHITRA